MKVEIENMPWQEGKVKHFLGKDLLARTNGTLKLVKVEVGASYPVHIHPDKTEFVYVLEGKPTFHIDTEIYHAYPHEFYIFPSNTKHAIQNLTDNECVLLVGGIQD